MNKNFKTFKRILTLCMAGILTVSSFAFAQEEYVVKYSEEAELLEAVGILDGEKTELSDKMTRGEFAEIYTNILNDGKIADDTESKFLDVSTDSKYFNATAFMSSMGYMTGHTDGTFRPDGFISYNEAMSVIVKILGYGVKATARGGYPTGYRIVANEIGLLSGAKAENENAITVDEACRLIYNSLFIAISEEISFGETTSYTSKNGNTLLNTYMDMDFAEGILSDNSVSSLSGESEIKENAILVDGIVIENAAPTALEKLGYYVRAYYKTDAKGSGNEFVYLSVSETKNSVLTIAAEDILPTSDLTKIDYEKNKKRTSAKVNSNAYYIKNGSASSLTASDIKIKAGAITLIDYDSDKTYDVILLDEYQTMVYKSINSNKDTLYGFYGEKIEFKNYDNVTVWKKGVEVTTDAIVPYDIIAVYKSKNAVKIEICTYVVMGTLTEISDEYYIIEGEKYTVSPEYEKASLKKPEVGQSGEFYFGKNNMLAYFEEATSENQGIAVSLSRNQDVFDTEKPRIKIYTTDGVFEIYDFEDKVEYNGNMIKSPDIYEKDELFSEGSFIRQPVIYELSEQGRIASLEFADSSKPDTDVLQAYSDSARSFRWCNPGTDAISPTADISGDNNSSLFITGKTYYFKLPEDINAERYYSVTKGTLPYQHDSVVSNTKAYFRSYDEKRFNIAGIVTTVVAVSRSGSWTQRQFVVEGISKGINPDGDTTQIVTGYTKGKEVSYYAVDAEINGIVPGDILQLNENNGDIVRYRKVYSIELDKTAPEWYKLHSTDGRLNDFYNIADADAVDSLNYYINKDLLSKPTSLFYHKNGFIEDKGSKYVSGVVTGVKDGYIEVTDDNNTKYVFYLTTGNVDYYMTYVYRYNKENENVSVESISNVGLDERVAVFTEAHSVVDIMIIE